MIFWPKQTAIGNSNNLAIAQASHKWDNMYQEWHREESDKQNTYKQYLWFRSDKNMYHGSLQLPI